MNKDFIELFHLQGLRITGTELVGKKMIIHCRSKQKNVVCPSCSKKITTIHKYLKPQRIKHMFWQGNLIELNLQKRAYFCFRCKKKNLPWVTVEQLPLIPKSKRYSLVYADQVIKGLGSTTFKTQQELAEASFQTVKRILTERIDPFIGVWPKDEIVISIGLDCHSFSGIKMLPSVTDITNHRLITILPNDKTLTVKQFLHNIPREKKELIEEVCIDMDTNYLKAIKEELPKAKIVVDFFHVVADANRRISDLRIIIQKVDKVILPKKLFDKPKEHLNPNERAELNNIFQAYPELGELWRVKEKIRIIHKTLSTILAKISYDALIKQMRISAYPTVKAWAKTLSRWNEEILQYFERHTTNGYTEGVNNKLKVIKRLSYGFRNIDNYIRKAMLSFITISLLLSPLYHHT
jgi:transposase